VARKIWTDGFNALTALMWDSKGVADVFDGFFVVDLW